MADPHDLRLDAGADFALSVRWTAQPSALSSAYVVGDATVQVYSTDDAPASGYIAIQPASTAPHAPPPLFFLSYTGTTPTTFTGCSSTGQSSTTAINCAAGCAVEPVRSLSGYSARLSIRRSVEDAAAVLALTSGSGLTLTAATGSIAVAITAAQTAALSGTYVYDLEVESSGGVITRLLQGRLHVSPQVTY